MHVAEDAHRVAAHERVRRGEQVDVIVDLVAVSDELAVPPLVSNAEHTFHTGASLRRQRGVPYSTEPVPACSAPENHQGSSVPLLRMYRDDTCHP